MYSALFGGGAVIRTWCSKAFGLQGPDGTRAFDFSGAIPDRPAFRRRYNAALNALPLTREEKEVICAQRQEIFRLNSTLFAEMRASAAYRRRVNACLGCLALVLLACHGLWSVLRR
jgi:heme oxygenase